jgi:serine-type D-Ala-D-Ala carboxypeptidase (penicillin-binding protein 5/6)
VEGQPAPPSVPARAWLLVDSSDGARLAASRMTARRAIASTTKLMTAYLARRELPLRRKLEVPRYDALPGESLMGLRPDDRVAVRELLYGLLLPSGNDAAVTLAEGVSGSVPDFVAEMNRAAERLGLDDTHYANPIGLDDPANYSTARDLARFAIRLQDDPVLARIFDTPSARLPGAHPERVVNHNELVREVSWVDGVKTGFTVDAQFVLIGSGTRHGVHLVSVVLGTPSSFERDQATLDLLRYGFSLYRRERAIRPGEPLASAAVEGGGELTLLSARGVRVSARKDQRLTVRTRAPDDVEGPLARGDVLGQAFVRIDGRVAGRVPLVAARAVAAESESLLDEVDGSIPGPRAVMLVGAGALAAIVIGIAVTLARRAGG